MPRLFLSLQTLGELDHGLAQGIVDADIRRAILDLENRGHDGKERKVEMRPIDDGQAAPKPHYSDRV